MFLSNFSIRQPVTTVAIVIVLMCLGLLALKNLRVNQIPDVENPVISVSFPYPGASPETVEREIINRVEKPLQSIPQVYEMWSNASESSAQFTIIFDFKKDMSAAADEIRTAVSQYHEAASGQADFTGILVELDALSEELRSWRADADARMKGRGADAAERRRVNATLRRIARLLVPLNYARGERFDHDPALKFGPVPRLEAAASLASAPRELRPFIQIGLVREANKVRSILRAARREIKASVELTV